MKGKRCKVEGCCVPSEKYCEPESPLLTEQKLDATYPDLWQEIYLALFYLPYSIATFIHDLYTHTVLKKPKRPTWGIQIAFTIAILHVVRSSFQKGSLSIWRAFLRIPLYLSGLKRYHEASFVAKKLKLPGICKVFDAHEDGTREIDAHWIFPLNDEGDIHDNIQEKIILYLHGGGYCAKDWQAYLAISQKLADYTGIGVFAISYRLAPETRFPGALVDAVQAYFQLIYEYKVKPHNIIVVGDSAGGGLTLSLLIYLRDHGYRLPGASILISPWVDLTYGHNSWLKAEVHDVLPPRPHIDALMNPARLYLGPKQYQKLSRHPYASPLFAQHFECLPPILVQSGGSETMTDEVRTFVNRLQRYKSTVSKHEEYEDMIHDFQAYPLAKSHQAFQNMKRWLQIDYKNPKL